MISFSEIVKGDSIFCASGITNSDVLKGITIEGDKFVSETLVTHKNTNFKKIIMFENISLKETHNNLEVTITHKNLQLSKGNYTLSMNVFNNESINSILGVNNMLSFQITHDKDFYHPFLLKCSHEINTKSN